MRESVEELWMGAGREGRKGGRQRGREGGRAAPWPWQRPRQRTAGVRGAEVCNWLPRNLHDVAH